MKIQFVKYLLGYLILILLQIPDINGNIANENNLLELINMSNSIVRGKVTEMKSYKEGQGRIYTDIHIVITENF